MSSEVATLKFEAPVTLLADEFLIGVRGRLQGITADTPAKYQVVRQGLAELRGIRKGLGESKAQLKMDAREWCDKVEAEYKRVLALVLEIEEPLKLEKDKVDSVKAEKRLEKIAEARAEQDKKDRIERERIQRQQHDEQAKLDAQRKEIEKQEAEAKERIRLAEVNLDAERRVMEKERQRLIDEEIARHEIFREAERVEREKLEAEERKVADLAELLRIQTENAEAKRLFEARRPDREKIKAFADEVTGFVDWPEMTGSWGKSIMEQARIDFIQIADVMREACNK